MDLALNNLQRLICHKTNQPTSKTHCIVCRIIDHMTAIHFTIQTVLEII